MFDVTAQRSAQNDVVRTIQNPVYFVFVSSALFSLPHLIIIKNERNTANEMTNK